MENKKKIKEVVNKKELIIMAGLPGAGKSYTRERLYKNYNIVDCDLIKTQFSDYDPNQPRALHSESKIVEKYEIYKNLRYGNSFVYDTTASNTEKIVKLIKRAQNLGYEVCITYVKVTLETAMYRNQNRFRVVPDDVILDKYEKLENALEVFKCYANHFITINNE